MLPYVVTLSPTEFLYEESYPCWPSKKMTFPNPATSGNSLTKTRFFPSRTAVGERKSNGVFRLRFDWLFISYFSD